MTEELAAELQHSTAAVAEDVNRGQIALTRERGGDLSQAILLGIQQGDDRG
nr:hypothetical protein [Cyanobium sp. ATX 6F1]